MLRCVPIAFMLLNAVGSILATSDAQAESYSIAEELRELDVANLIRTSVGVTRRGSAIEAVIAPADLELQTKKTRILLVAGAAGDRESASVALNWMQWFYQQSDTSKYRQNFVLSVIPCLNPDGLALGTGPANGSEGNPTRGYPPPGSAYDSKTDPEAAYLWRWIGMHAPDLVVELSTGDEIGWRVTTRAAPQLQKLTSELKNVSVFEPDDSLVAQLAVVAPCDTGTIPALQVKLPANQDHAVLESLLDAANKANFSAPSPARRELQRRLAKSPHAISCELLESYGKQLKEAVYIQSLAVIGRMRNI